MNYKRIHDAIIKHATSLNRRYDSKMHHRHHIIPRSIGGTNDKVNLVVLTFKEHFVVHHLLCKIYPDEPKLLFAFNSMCNKYPKNKNTGKYIRARQFPEIKRRFSVVQRELHKGWVWATDPNGNKVKVTREEYKTRNDLSFHTKGKIWAVDHLGNYKWVSTEEFHADPCLSLGRSEGHFSFINTETGELVQLTKEQARNLNRDHKKWCFENKIPINKALYKQKVESTINEQQKAPGPGRRKGGVIAFDVSTGETTVVTSENFEANPNFVGTTKNMATVLDPNTGTYVKVEQRKAVELGLRGPNVGKVNAIHIHTGIKQQITKDEFNNGCFISASNPKLIVQKGRRSVHYLEFKHKVKSVDRPISEEEIAEYELILEELLKTKDQTLTKFCTICRGVS